MSNDDRIISPIQLKQELAGVKNLDIAFHILRRSEWQIVKEMEQTLFTTSLYTDIGDRNESLLGICNTLIRWVRSLVGGDDQTVIDKGLAAKTINEIMSPHDMLYECVVGSITTQVTTDK